MAVPQYHYRSLDLSRDAIRLVRLCKGYDGPLRCELFESFLHDCDGVPYCALSYTWGGTVKQHEITINGCTFFITENLYWALWNLREQHVDLGQMRNIYENAEEVVVWLGIGSPVLDTAMDVLDRVNRYINHTNNWKRSKEIWLSELKHRRELFFAGLEQGQIEKQQQALQVLFNNPWFKRIWIIQEVAHAKRATIFCDRRSVPARALAIAPPFIRYHPEKHVQAIPDVMPGFHRHESWWMRQRTLNNLLEKFQDSEATDTRDKVYALLEMAVDVQGVISPDYEVSEGAVVQRVAAFLFLETW
ncbi:hypothetical protein QBC40DRAFT_321255 [Triangularia verruculosa]|uniref:Heterokaryon incompatibility domain-containing protein n=1 Tax=Triangularia verruculosa TaxID=2587418 RepID=A0AAN7AP08_9PEZI|nr:hypothetical protein QBC40DRAFT_321255 [Triangularia verruculosa]